jgi:hypothetical protein
MNLWTLQQPRILGDATLGGQDSLTDPDLVRLVQNYKRVVASRYRSADPSRLAEEIPAGRLFVSPKIDGELWFLILDPGHAAFFASPTGRILTGAVPVLAEAQQRLLPKIKARTVFAGELWAATVSGRPRVRDVAKALGDASELPRLAYTAFDLVLGGDEPEPETPRDYPARLEVLQRMTDGGKRLRAVKTEAVHAAGDVARLYGEWAEGGKAEGVIVRADDGKIYKVKPIFHLDVGVLGYTVRTEDAGQVRNLLLALMRRDGTFHIVGSVGNLGTEDDRRALFRRLSTMHAESRYRYASREGAMFQFVRPEMVVEVAVTDVQAEDPNGKALPRMVVAYEDTRGWYAVQPFPGVSLFAPRLERVRQDKAVNPDDLRMSQLTERVYLEEPEVGGLRPELPPSDKVRRQVWVKSQKGVTSVRKLVIWRTGKEAAPGWPAYVVHWTDYSPGRKDPLQREVRQAPDRDTAEQIAAALIDENIKKGWVQVAD